MDAPRYVVDLRAVDYVSDYDGHLMCLICHCPFLDPIRLDCDHIFCRECLDSFLKIAPPHQPDEVPCPTCRAFSTTAFVKVPRLIVSMCDDIRVKCPFAARGCQEVVQRGLVQLHVDKYCDYRLVPCPNKYCEESTIKKEADAEHCVHQLVECDQCGETLPDKALKKHLHSCPKQEVRCPWCDASMFRAEVNSHLETCPDVLHPCPGAQYGCTISTRKDEAAEHTRHCPFVALAPYLDAQAARMAATEANVRRLEQRNGVLEDALAAVRRKVSSRSRHRPSRRNEPPAAAPVADMSMDSFPELPPADGLANDVDPNVINPSVTPTTTTTPAYLLSLHERLRAEVIQLSGALVDLDGRASMSLLNETHRLREDMAHLSAALNSMRVQVHWLMDPRFHQYQLQQQQQQQRQQQQQQQQSREREHDQEHEHARDRDADSFGLRGLAGLATRAARLSLDGGSRAMGDVAHEGTKL